MVLYYSRINCTMTTFCDLFYNNPNKKDLDVVLDHEKGVESWNNGMYIFYYKSKGSMLVSPRDQYTVNRTYYNEITKYQREYIDAGKSKEFSFGPPIPGIVRSWVYISGTYVLENRSPEGIWCDVY